MEHLCSLAESRNILIFPCTLDLNIYIFRVPWSGAWQEEPRSWNQYPVWRTWIQMASEESKNLLKSVYEVFSNISATLSSLFSLLAFSIETYYQQNDGKQNMVAKSHMINYMAMLTSGRFIWIKPGIALNILLNNILNQTSRDLIEYKNQRMN